MLFRNTISKQKTKYWIILLLFLIFFLSVTKVYAHSGKTDSDGGHYDKETGEYHYHHGYPAHQHYDMNGDGKADCPYDFKDKTSTAKYESSTKTTNKTNNNSSKYSTKRSNNDDIEPWEFWSSVIICLPFIIPKLMDLYEDFVYWLKKIRNRK